MTETKSQCCGHEIVKKNVCGWCDKACNVSPKESTPADLLLSQKQSLIREVETKVGALRQWLNEDRITDPKKMVTNEQLLVWLDLWK